MANVAEKASKDRCREDRPICAANEQKLDNGDINARKSHICGIVDAIAVDDRALGIAGSSDVP
ncbi:hypothetical protein MXD81_59820 [Microbacteriaceae bacterium K1510]|nr:hypothetical protein [Microbacteriaceae bacterium K1510]